MLTASAIENALSVSVRMLPKLPVLYKTDAIISSLRLWLMDVEKVN
jgi:hypothetical protein